MARKFISPVPAPLSWDGEAVNPGPQKIKPRLWRDLWDRTPEKLSISSREKGQRPVTALPDFDSWPTS